ETLAVGFGYDPAEAFGSAKPPLVLTSTFVYPSAQAALDFHRDFFAGEAADGYIYARLGHPNLAMVEARMAALDGAEDCAGFNSGMAAASTVALAFVRAGDSLIHSRPIYSGVDALVRGPLAEMGVHSAPIADACDEGAIRIAAEAALRKGPLGLILLESPANPTAALADIALVRRIADEIGKVQGRRPLISVDNTFLGPLLQSPLAHGADLVLTSLTKYCGGHSDLLAGSVSGAREPVAKLKALRTILGNHMTPFSAWLLLRSFESLAARQDRAQANADHVARFLEGHPKVESVTWLSLLAEGSLARAVYDRQCRGAGSTFSFTIRGGQAAAFRLLDALELLKVAVSLGGSETLICHPATTTHYVTPAPERVAGGVTEGTLRLSVGLEHPDDLLADLARGLEAA
ncbi:MAG TPA: aminotransferase class I/II-fold pyridoxal phosphate-dependent enzyme, partial [Caulobacteraceae bacterium]